MDSIIDLDEFIKRIKMRMDMLGLNKSQLAKRADLSRTAITQFFSKSRTPSGEVLVKLAESLTVSVDFLLGRTSESKIEDLLQHEGVFELLSTYAELSERDQDQIMVMVRLLKKASLDSGTKFEMTNHNNRRVRDGLKSH